MHARTNTADPSFLSSLASAILASDLCSLSLIVSQAGLHGSALAYYLTQRGEKPLVVERHSVAAAASGKGGGFLARDWGSGPTVALHKVSFALHEELANELDIKSYRKIPVLSVSPGTRTKRTNDICPWLDGDIADSKWMDKDGGAQVAPLELCTKLMNAAVAAGATLQIGTVEGVEKSGDAEERAVSAVKVDGELIPCKAFCCTMGPWAALAQDWFDIPVPMTGIKSTSVVFKDNTRDVEPFALFCGEDDRFGTHLEVYPRNSGEVYLCGIGGSEYGDGDQLRAGEYPPGEVHADPKRVEAATKSFSTMSRRLGGKPDVVQACSARVRDLRTLGAPSRYPLAAAHKVSRALCSAPVPARRQPIHGPRARLLECLHVRRPQLLGHPVGTGQRQGHERAHSRRRSQLCRPAPLRPSTLCPQEAGRPRAQARRAERGRAMVKCESLVAKCRRGLRVFALDAVSEKYEIGHRGVT